MTATAEPTAAVARGRAAGKVILLGEHAVVYGSPALVAGVDRGLTAELRRQAGGGPSQLTLGGATVAAAERDELPLALAWQRLLAAGGCPPVRGVVAGNLPAGVGLGFSATAAVALARAVEQLQGGPVVAARVRERAMAWERVFHGNPSGVDVAAAMQGGLLRFTRAEGITSLEVEQGLALCIGLTGGRSPTAPMVARVAGLRRAAPAKVDRIVARLAAAVEQAIAALQAGALARLGGLLDEGQRLLTELGVSSAALERLCASAKEHGALGAKLTGAGGGGAVVALIGAASTDADQQVAAAVLAGWRDCGCQGFAVRVGATVGSASPEGRGHG